MRGFYILFLLRLFVDCDSSSSTYVTLKKLLVVFVHSQAAPELISPTDPNRNHTCPKVLGNLTMSGMSKALDLGSYLRHRYREYLTFNPDEVFARSSPMQRSIETTNCILNGIYNPSDTANCYNDTGFTAAPIYTVQPYTYDHLLNSKSVCPKYSTLVLRDHNKTAAQYEWLVEELRNLTGCPGLTYDNILLVYTEYELKNLNNLTVPSWFYRLKRTMEERILFRYETKTNYKEAARLLAGFLLHDMIGRITDGYRKSERLLLYGTHGSMIISLMKLLQIYNGRLPPGASAIIVEVNRRNRHGHDYIDIFFRNSSSMVPYKMPILGCADPCSVENFIRLTHDLVIANPEEACKLSTVES